MPNDKRLQQFLDLLDGRRLSDEQVTRIVEMLAKYVVQNQDKTNSTIEAIKTTLEKLKDQIKGDNDAALSGMKGQVDTLFVENRLKEIEKDIRKLHAQLDGEMKMKLSKVKDGAQGMQGERGERGLSGANGSPDTPSQVVAKVNQNGGVEQEAITGLVERLEKLETPRLGGGGTSAIGVANALNFAIKRETPSGAINGVNTAYTVTKQIMSVISIAINGMVIHDNEYTVSGQTITFTTALPAALSGTTFRVVYV